MKQPNSFIEPIELKGIDSKGLEYTSELVKINPNYVSKDYRYSYGFTGTSLRYIHIQLANRFL